PASLSRTFKDARSYRFRRLVRLLVEIHVRRRLIELGKVYFQLELLPRFRDESGSADQWLVETRKSCLEVAERLQKVPLSISIILAIIPLVVPVSTALSKLPGATAGAIAFGASIPIVVL